MKDAICCCIFCLGIGMIAGAAIVSSNKKVYDFLGQGSKAIKDSVEDIKENVQQTFKNK